MPDTDFMTLAQAAAERLNSLSGLEYLRDAIANKHNYPFGELLNMWVTEASDGMAVVEAEPTYASYNPMMRVHGGYLASLVDSSLGSAVISKLPAGSGAGTVSLNVNYVRKVDVDSGRLTARAVTLHAGRSMLTAETKITDQKGRLCVHGSGTFLIYVK